MPSRRRTPLYDRHVAAGAKIVDFAGWEMPVQYPARRARRAHGRARALRHLRRLAHGRDRNDRPRRRGAAAAPALKRSSPKISIGGAQYSVLCDEQGGVLDDLFTYRLEPDRYLTVTNASNHERDLAWFREHAADLDVADADRSTTTRCLPSRARSRARSCRRSPTRRCRARMTAGYAPPLRSRGARVRHRLHRRGRRRAAARARRRAGVVERAAASRRRPAGLAARDTLRLEACFHLYGNDLSIERNPIEAGLGWCCREDTGFIGAEAVRAQRASAAAAERLVAFVLDGPGIARQGNPVVGGGVVTSGTLSPCLEVGIGMAYVPAAAAQSGTPIEIDVRGKHPRQATIQAGKTAQYAEKERADGRGRATQMTCCTTPSTIGRASTRRPGMAVLGITWYAQDALGEVVFFDPPAVGTHVSKDEPYAEVESVKAVSDVVAPLSGEIVEVNDGLADAPDVINEDPYGEGWLVKVRLSDPAEREALMDAAAYSATIG